jgi:hypothetical protein
MRRARPLTGASWPRPGGCVATPHVPRAAATPGPGRTGTTSGGGTQPPPCRPTVHTVGDSRVASSMCREVRAACSSASCAEWSKTSGSRSSKATSRRLPARSRDDRLLDRLADQPHRRQEAHVLVAKQLEQDFLASIGCSHPRDGTSAKPMRNAATSHEPSAQTMPSHTASIPSHASASAESTSATHGPHAAQPCGGVRNRARRTTPFSGVGSNEYSGEPHR